MDQNRFLRVIKKYQDNQLSESERLLMDEWMNEVAKDQGHRVGRHALRLFILLSM